jgi:hypothetical protein
VGDPASALYSGTDRLTCLKKGAEIRTAHDRSC